ncbi:MAG: SIP domain-containing protein, partial [Actinomycetota bacterium]
LPTEVRWVAATTAEEVRVGLLGALPDEVPTGTRAYVTGELQMMRAVRTFLQERGVPRRAVRCHAHWTPSKRGM